MKTKVLIVAYHNAGLIRIFRQAAVVRLTQLAATLANEVGVWLTPEVYAGLEELHDRLPPSVSWQVLSAEEMLHSAVYPLSKSDEPVAVLKGHSVWNRGYLETWLASVSQTKDLEILEDWGGLLPGGRWATVIQKWLAAPTEPPAPAHRLLPYLLSSGEEDTKAAEARLVAALATATCKSDGFMARHVDRRLSRRISPHLANLGMRPNWITLISTLIGLTGAWLLAQAGYTAHLAGALLFLGAVILDGVDGEVARLTLQETRFGHYLDILTDNLVNIAVFIGIAVGLSRATDDVRHLYALLALLIGFGLCALSVYQVLGKASRLAPHLQPRVIRWLALLNNRDFAYLVVLLALIDRLAWFLWGAAAGTYLFAFSLWLLWRFSRKEPLPETNITSE